MWNNKIKGNKKDLLLAVYETSLESYDYRKSITLDESDESDGEVVCDSAVKRKHAVQLATEKLN